MPSRLSSLLVRDGLVGVKRMEKAFQRQVIYGGSLDTILLEMSLVSEERLIQYLALASGLPPAARDEGVAIEPAATALVPGPLAAKYRAVPLGVAGDAVRVLVCAPLEIAELEDLADALDRPLQPLIAPEYRWNLVYAAAYGLDPPARFTTLARTLDADAIISPVGRARTVIIEDATARAAARTSAQQAAVEAIAPVPASDETLKLQTAVDLAHAAAGGPTELARRHRPTIVGLTPNRASTDPGVIAPRPAGRGDGVPEPAVAPLAETFKGTAVAPGPRPAGIQPAPAQASAASPGPDADTPPRPPTDPAAPASRSSQPISTEGRDAPLTVLRARDLLAIAEDRDTVFLTLLQAARSRARWAGLLTVQGGAAIGRVALAEPTLDTAAFGTVLIPLDVASPFRTVVQKHQPHVGPIATGDASLDAMLLRLGGTVPPSALVLPVVLRDRVVAVVVAHRVLSDLRLVDVTELLPLATAAADALGRLIAKSKAAGSRAPTEPPVVEVDAELVDTRRIQRASDDPWRAPVPAAPPVSGLESGEEVSMTAEPPLPIAELLDAIERATEGAASDFINEAVERTAETLGELNRRFPGTLRVERFSVNGRALRAAQYGGLLELVIALGAGASELLIEKMASPQRDIRFYATVCCAELRPRSAVHQLAERLFDQDFGVRACAVEALAGYPVSDLGHALVRSRRALHSTDPEVVSAAAVAAVALGDVEAVGDLIAVIERGDRSAEQARRALVALTAQDFGASDRKWRKWYETARKRHRIEWLIDGLSHKEDAIRETAINDLRRLTGEYFGYHHDLPRRERDAAASRWSSWWRDAGQRRFVVSEDERHRPTAVLPSRHERD